MGVAKADSRPSSLLVALLTPLALCASPSRAADLSAPAQADLRRAYAMAKLSTSEEPAVRAEHRAHEPSAGFMLGAALGAWTAAAAQLNFDLKNPAGAGPPHVSQTGGDADALEQDCADEKTAFARLDSRAAALDLTPAQVIDAAGAMDTGMADAWRARRAGPVAGCR